MLSNEARRARLDELFRLKASAEGEIAELLDEEERSESFRDEGATSVQAWIMERYGVAASTARALTHVCRHHHGVVHRKGWTMSGDANEELTFVAPNGRVMRSRPSPRWAAATAGR